MIICIEGLTNSGKSSLCDRIKSGTNYCLVNNLLSHNEVTQRIKRITNPIENNDSIYIYFKKKDIDPINKSLYIDYTEQTTIKSYITGYFLQDSEYNSNHWMSTIDLSYIQQVI